MHWRIRGKSSSRLLRQSAIVGLGGVCHWLGVDGKLVTMFDYRVILALLTLGVHPCCSAFSSVRRFSHKGQAAAGEHRLVCVVGAGSPELALLACVCLLQGAHAAYYGFSAITGRLLATRPRRWAICGRWACGGSHYLCAE